MLKRFVLSLLLAPVAIATPVSGKELAVKALQGTTHDDIARRAVADVYEPDIAVACRHLRLGPPADTGRKCFEGNLYRFYCRAHPHDVGHAGEAPLVRGVDRCEPTHMCMPVKWERGEEGDQVAPDDWVGDRRILCMRMAEDVSVTDPKGKGKYEMSTPQSHIPPFPDGTMYGSMELTGDIKEGSHPMMSWKYTNNARPGINLAGSHVLTNREVNAKSRFYPIQVNYDHVARFSGVVQYLHPDHDGDITLTARMAWFGSSILAVKRDILHSPRIDDMGISGNDDIVETDV